jgi:hypothetical protein
MVDVVQSIKDLGYTNLKISDASKLGNKIFGPGAKLGYFVWSGTNDTFAASYNPGGWDWAYSPDVKLAAGDIDTCKLSNQPDASPTATLDLLIARLRGTPRINAQSTPTGKGGAKLDSGIRNDGWGATTLGLATLGNAPTFSKVTDASSYYTGNTELRIGFTTANAVNYYSCQQRWDGRARNCDAIGKGGYTLETLGDAKVMRFSGLPTAFTSVNNWLKVFVQRGVYVHHGYQALPSPGKSARMNAVATNGLLSALGITKVIDPAALLTLTPQSDAGEYSGTLTGTEGGAVGHSGDFWIKLTSAKAADCSLYFSGLVTVGVSDGMSNCSNFSIVPRAGEGTVADISFTMTAYPTNNFTGTIDFYTGLVTGNFAGTDAAGSWKGSMAGQRG